MNKKIIEVSMKWIFPSIKNRSVDLEDKLFNFRLKKAREQYIQACKSELDEKYLVDCVNEFLDQLGMKIITNPKIVLKNTESHRISYSKIRSEYGNQKDDIVWIKLSVSESGIKMISVIGTSEDIFFTENTKNNSSSGKINKKLKLEWVEDYVYIFPLLNIPEGLYRSDIESGIGNYLIDKGFPILDYYSHNF